MFKTLIPLLLLVAASVGQQDYTQYVDVFFGTTNGGNMFPGVVAAPFAAVKLGPDFAGDGSRSGYSPTGKIGEFSLMHESGTGGSPKYGTVSQLPIVGTVDNPLADIWPVRASPDNGTVGYYKTSLANGITVELAGTEHAGFYQYTFPTNQSQPGVLVDASQFLTSKLKNNLAQSYNKGSIHTFPDGHYEGSTSLHGGWNLAAEWTIYFCGRFNETPALVQTFSGVNTTLHQLGSNPSVSGTERLGAIYTFQKNVVSSRVGISWISTEKACQFIDTEMPSNTTLQQLVDSSKSKWNSQVFSKVTTTETNKTLLGQLYTSLYGMHLLPSNRTGENPNPKWDGATPYYDDFYTLWDLYRSMTPLLHILQPIMYEEMIRSLIGIFQVDGYMPDGRSSNFNGRSQGGSSADNVLADAYVKGVRGKVDWNAGYAAMVKDAETTPPNNHDPSAKDSSTQQGRGALRDWLNLGFISTRFTRSVSRAVEYSTNDFAVYQVANGLGKRSDAMKYLFRSRNWRNHWSPEAASKGTTGFLVPRKPDGIFTKQDPGSCGGCYWGDAYYEGKPWEYTVNAHHDIIALIDLGNGIENFSRRLQTLLDPAQKLADMGNEPSFGSPYLFNFIRQQAQSVKVSRAIAKTRYHPGPDGLPGNSDAGALQSWLLWNMIGLYPLTGQTTFLIGSPWFSDMKIELGSGKALHITATGGDSDNAIYVQSLKINGHAWNKNWLTWQDVFANGGTMEFVLGTNMSKWDTGDIPPSPASSNNPRENVSGYQAAKLWHRERERVKRIAIGVGTAGAVLLIASAVLGYCLWRKGLFWRKRPSTENAEPKKAEEEKKKMENALNGPTRLSLSEAVRESVKSKITLTDELVVSDGSSNVTRVSETTAMTN